MAERGKVEMLIMRTPAFDIARNEAKKEDCAYGIGVTDGLYYVGHIRDLEKLPVVVKHNYKNDHKEK